jgi:hypothetical protein
LQQSVINFILQGFNQPPVLVIVEPTGAGRKHDHPGTALAKKEQFHIATQMRAMPAMILSMHALIIQQAFHSIMTIVLIFCKIIDEQSPEERSKSLDVACH